MHKFIAFSCLHAPITNREYLSWLVGLVEDEQPDTLVNLGDWYEGKAAKRWPAWSDEKWSLQDEHQAVAAQAGLLNAAAPGAAKVWLYGNHDDNLFGMQPDRISEDLKDAVQWKNNKDVSEALEDWLVVDRYSHRARFRLGPVTFQHGCDISASSDKDGAYLYGVPFGLYVRGHTHRPLQVTRCQERRVPMPYWTTNPGTGIDFDRCHYMDRMSMALWGRGVIVGEVPDSSVKQHRTAYASKNWDAELRIHSTAM